MTFIVKTAYIIGTLLIGGYCYHWLGTFKRLSEFSCNEFNEDMDDEKQISERQALAARNFSYTIFMLGSILCWAMIGTTMGRIASEVTSHNILKWIVYLLMYIGFVRIPLGTTSGAISYLYEVQNMSEKTLLRLVALSFYVLAIFCYDMLPGLFTWHLYFLN